MIVNIYRVLNTLAVVMLVSSCSGGNQSTADPLQNPLAEDETTSMVTMAPEGRITHYGAVTIGDEQGIASDLVASFYRLNNGVSEKFMLSMLAGDTTMCQVQDDGVIDFEEISAGYVPNVPGMEKTAVSAGETIVLSSPAGTYATLDEQPTAGFLFYDLVDMTMLADDVIPDGLIVDIPGSNDVPAISGATVPQVTPLSGFSVSGDGSVFASSRFSWRTATDSDALVRIFTSTAGGFFLEDGVTVTCITPDTGSFEFPSQIRTLLGGEFKGSPPIASRLRANAVVIESTVVYILRESFAVE